MGHFSRAQGLKQLLVRLLPAVCSADSCLDTSALATRQRDFNENDNFKLYGLVSCDGGPVADPNAFEASVCGVP